MKYGFASDKHRDFPPMVVVSIVNVCNLRCVHCYYSKYAKLPGYKPNYMEFELWKKIMDEMKQYPWSILNLGTDGEPLLHKQFVELMRYARQCEIVPINLTTNGVLLEGDLAETLIREDLLDVINISLDAFSPEKYKAIRGGTYDRVYRNVHRIIELRDSHKAMTKIQVNIIDQPEVHDEVDSFRDYWEGKADQVLVRTYYDATSVTGQTGGNITGKQKEFDEIKRWPCQQFWRRFNIGDDGTAHFCVDDWFKKTRIGDINKQSIREIWTGPEYERLRELHLSGKFEEIDYCSTCTEWQGMKWDYDYFTAMSKLLGKDLL
jgi:radical SAM protein with 4Fe4S-binding SPASM domain